MVKDIKLKFFIGAYLLVIFGLFLYSFTQVDLGLTLTRLSIWQILQTSFQYIGYFNRPLSTAIFISLIISLFAFYILFLWLSHKNLVSKKQIWFVIIFVCLILTFSYNAFSYDLFNYVFDAKIVTFYGQNPYEYKALDYPGDPMLSFMHWTHRTLPYGPTWLFLTVPLSYLGLQYLLPTLILFKILMSMAFLGTVYFIGKILNIILPKNNLFGLILFALNPLVLIESLVSSHNDIVMVFFIISSFYFLITKKYFKSILLFMLSIGVKYATVFLLPVFILFLYFKRKKNLEKNLPKLFFLTIILMIFAVFGASYRTNFQPWYLLYIVPFTALLSKKYYVFIPTIIFSLFALLQYVPFLYLGNWDKPVPTILFWLIISSIIFSVIFSLIWFWFYLKKTW